MPSNQRRPQLAVSTALFRGSAVCLVRRNRDQAYGGLWSLPGGGVEFGEGLAEAASRELAEETGLHVPPDDLRFIAPHEAIGSEFHAVIAVHAARLADDGPEPVAGDDAAEARFVSAGELLELDVARRTTPCLAAIVRRAAAILTNSGFNDRPLQE